MRSISASTCAISSSTLGESFELVSSASGASAPSIKTNMAAAIDNSVRWGCTPHLFRRDLVSGPLRVRRVRAQHQDEHGRCNRQKRALCLHFGPLRASAKTMCAGHSNVARGLEGLQDSATLNSSL